MIQYSGLKITVIVAKSDGVKCPRCWKYWGIPDNYQGCCDECIAALIEGMDDWVAAGNFSRETADEALAEIKRFQQLQLKKFSTPIENREVESKRQESTL